RDKSRVAGSASRATFTLPHKGGPILGAPAGARKPARTYSCSRWPWDRACLMPDHPPEPSSSSRIAVISGTRSLQDASSVLFTVTKLPSINTLVTPGNSKMRLARGDSAAASFDVYDLLPCSMTFTLRLNLSAFGFGV